MSKVIWMMTNRRDLPEVRKGVVGEHFKKRLDAARKAICKTAVGNLPKRMAKETKRNLGALMAPIENSAQEEFRRLLDPLENREARPMAPAAALSFNPRLKILFFAADPTSLGSAPLNLDEEFKAIQQAIQRSQLRDQIDLEACLAATRNDLLNALNQHRPRIVHFGGHGKSDGIVLQEEDGTASVVGEAFLAQVFSTLSADIQLVVLSACHTRIQAEAISSAISISIGTDDLLSDKSAIDFSRTFYGAIGDGLSVGQAYSQAVALLASSSGESSPKILCRENVDPISLILTRTPAGDTYEPLAQMLNRISRKFFLLDQELAQILERGADLLLTASQHRAVELPRELFRALMNIRPAVEAELQKGEAYLSELGGLSLRWGKFLNDSATGKLARLEQAIFDYNEQLSVTVRPLFPAIEQIAANMEGGGPNATGEEMASLSSCLKEILIYMTSIRRTGGLYYNQLLEFLPGNLLENKRVLPVTELVSKKRS